MLMRAMTSLLMMTAGLTACLDSFEAPAQGTPSNPDSNNPDPNDPDPNDPDPNDPDPNDPDPNDPDPNDPDPNDPDPNDPNDPGLNESRTWCQPSALEAPVNVVLPEVPPEALDRVCALATETTDYIQNTQRQVTRYTWDGDVLWVEYHYSGYRNLLKLTFDAAGHRIEAQYGQQKGSGGLVFATYEDTYRYRYDGAGHVSEYATLRGGLEHVWMNQRWVDGVLVERNEERNYYDGSSNDPIALPLRRLWRYEDGRLAGASATFRDSSWTVDWFYDGQGRPILVERKRDGVMFGRMTWSFDDHNRLARRTVLRDPTIESPDGYGPGTLDTLGVDLANEWNGDPWANAVPRFSDAGCLILPSSDQYGYPGDAVEYELGSPRDDRPNGIGFSYGANTYGWNYGDLAWYSHAGVHGFEPQYGKVQSDLRYVQGRLVEETMSSASGPIIDTHRVRTFEAGSLTVDRMDISVSPEPYPDAHGNLPERTTRTYGRELRFTWDAMGLVQRDLVDDDVGLIEWQTWARDSAGRWLTHSLFGLDLWASRAAIPIWGGEYDPCTEQSCDLADAKLRVLYSRTLDAAGRTTERRVSRPDAQGVPTQEQVDTWRYDAAGRLVEQASNGTYVQTWEYDDAGRLVRNAYDYDGVGDDDGWTTTTYDASGRWIEAATFSAGTLYNRTTRAFACESSDP